MAIELPTWVRRCPVAAALCVGAAAGVPSGHAAAHASLISTDPAADAVLDVGPSTVTLRFDEPVTVDLAGIRVFGPDGDRVDAGPTGSLDDGATPTVDVDAGAVGTYTVAWKVVSEDSHVLSGTFLFHVQARTGAADVADQSSGGLGVVGWLARWAIFAGATVLAGLAVFRIAVASRLSLDDRTSVRLARVAAGTLFVGAALRLVVQVAETSGRSVPAAFGVVDDAVRATRAGQLDAARLGVAAVAVAAAVLWRARAAVVVALLAATATMAVNSLSGHAWTVDPSWASVAVDVVHQAGAAVWIGGLAAIAIVVVKTPGPHEWAVRRFSTVALGSVAVLTVTGIASGLWQSAARPDVLLTSRYGVVLGVKLVLVGLMVALGWWQRARLLSAVDATGRLFRMARGELVLGALVVAATAALVNIVPAREDIEPDPYRATLDDGAGAVSVTVDPARPGANVFHLYFFDETGAPRTVDVAEASVVQGGLPPRQIELLVVTPNHLTATDFTMPAPGPATFTVDTLSRGVPATFTFEVPIR